MKRRSITLFALTGTLLLLLMGLLSACGDSQEKTEMGVDGYVYTICGSTSLSFTDGLRLKDGYLYYIDESGYKVRGIPVDGALFSGEEVPEEVFEKAGLLKHKAKLVYSGRDSLTYTLDDNGNLYTFEILTTLNTQGLIEVVGKKLVATGADGSVLYEMDFSDIQEILYGTSINMRRRVPIQADGEGNVYVLMEGTIYVVNPQGTVTSQISTVGYRKEGDYGNYDYLPENLIRSQNGRIYYVAEGRGYKHWRIWEIVRGDGYELRELEGFQGNFDGVISDGFQNPAVIGSDGFLYEYDPETSSSRKILRMEDSNIRGDYLQAAFQLSEEYLLAVCKDWDKGFWDYTCYLLKKNAVDDLPQKEVIVLACLYPGRSYALREAVTAFNQSNKKYHVMIESYGCVVGDPETEEAARLRLDSALVSSNPPDLLDLNLLDIYKYASKDALEDLAPYIEKSELLDIGDYFENIIEDYTINGRLICVPSYFQISLFWSRIAQTGSDLGWTINDMMELAERYPESRLLDSADWRGSDWVWQNILGDYCVDRFVDFTGGTCDFQNEEFERIVKWAGDHHGEGDWVSRLYDDDDLLLKWEETWFGNFSSFIRFEVLYADTFVLKGYPTADGRPRYKAAPTDEVGIVSVSDKKEGAWEFLEYLMGLNDEDPKLTYGIAFNSRRTFTEGFLEYMMEPEYFYGSNGEEILKPKTRVVVDYWEGYDFYGLSREQADRLMEMLESVDFRPRSSAENAIIDIIMEETASFYNGDKSIELVMEIIQNRASLLVQEGQ